MIKILVRTARPSILVLSAALWSTFAGCNKAPDAQSVSTAAVQPQPVAAAPAPAAVAEQPAFAMQDDYVYYPGYEVYYSSNRHQYVYRDGNAWVTRSAPPRVSVDVLFASPSIRMDFHDSPERHHEAIMRSYPRNWAPSNDRRERDDRKDEKKDDRNGVRR